MLTRLNCVTARPKIASSQAGADAIALLGAVLLAVSDPDWIPNLAQRWYEAARLLVDVENSELGAVSDVLRMIESSEHPPDERDRVSAWIADSTIGRSLVK